MNTPLRVLFVEDSEADMQIILQALRNGGYAPDYQRVDGAATMQLALQRQSWDLLICDYLMPAFSAPDALKILQAAQLDIPFIVLSGMMGEDVAVEMMRAGANDYLFKGQIKRLVPAIARELKDAESRRAKRAAEAALSRLAAIVESSEDAIVSTDLQGAVLTWNPGAEQLYGYSAAEVIGQPLASLIYPQLSSARPVQLDFGAAHPAEPQSQAAAASRQAIGCQQIGCQQIDCQQVVQRRKTGELIEVSLTVSLVKDADGAIEGLAMIARDISERQMVQRMKDEFISIINHELRTPLASLQGSIELLLTGKLGELSGQGLRMLEIAANNIDRLVQLTGNILDLEGLSIGNIVIQKQPCDVEHLLSLAAEQNSPMADRHGVRLLVTPVSQGALQPNLQPTHQPTEIFVDPQRTIQVLNHLILNAVQSSQPGGSIWLTAEVQSPEQACCRDLPPIPHLIISVKDQGLGIPADKLETIFGQFQQVDASDSRRQGGAGLGLTICRSIVQYHQGRLWAESVLGQGSTFYLALPMQRVAVEV